MIYLNEADLIARLFIQEIKINTSFRFPSIKLEFNRIRIQYTPKTLGITGKEIENIVWNGRRKDRPSI